MEYMFRKFLSALRYQVHREVVGKLSFPTATKIKTGTPLTIYRALLHTRNSAKPYTDYFI